MKKYLVLGLAALLLTTVVSPDTALAGGRGSGGKTPPGAMTVAPNPAQAWGGAYTATASGLIANETVMFSVSEPGCCIAFNVAADASGNATFSRTTGYPGTYKISAYQYSGRKLTLMASVSFEVVEP